MSTRDDWNRTTREIAERIVDSLSLLSYFDDAARGIAVDQIKEALDEQRKRAAHYVEWWPDGILAVHHEIAMAILADHKANSRIPPTEQRAERMKGE